MCPKYRLQLKQSKLKQTMSSSEVIKPYALLGLNGIALDVFVYCPFIVYWTINIFKRRESLMIRKDFALFSIISFHPAQCWFLNLRRDSERRCNQISAVLQPLCFSTAQLWAAPL